MRKLNRQGFTLVELIATLVVLALVMSIGGYSIIKIIQKSNDKNYDLLIENIKDAAELYYQECRYGNSDIIECTVNVNDDDKIYSLSDVTLGNLVTYGFLKGNGTTGEDKLTTLVNPNNNVDISGCEIKIEYSSGKINVTSTTENESCPDEY